MAEAHLAACLLARGAKSRLKSEAAWLDNSELQMEGRGEERA